MVSVKDFIDGNIPEDDQGFMQDLGHKYRDLVSETIKEGDWTVQRIFSEASDALLPPKELSVVEAAENFVHFKDSGRYSRHVAPYMMEPMNLIPSRSHQSITFVGCARSSKALALDTPIPTPTGWTTMGDISKGDVILDADGKPTIVSLATPVMHDHDCYEVKFSDGETIIADADHLWTVKKKNKKGGGDPDEITLMTREMLDDYVHVTKKGKKRYVYLIDNTKPLKLHEADLPIDPYILGYWLGDGTSSQGRITTASADLPNLLSELSRAGHIYDIVVDRRNNNVIYVNVDRRKNHKSDNGSERLITSLRNNKLLCNKHIPIEYLRASYEQRLELLRGLMDSDGSVGTKGESRYVSSNEVLANGVYELLMTLGIKASITSRTPRIGKVEYSKSYAVHFHTYDNLLICKLERKQSRINPRPKNDHRYEFNTQRKIVGITKVKSVPVRCIQVDNPRHLFLAGKGMIPTHNTLSLIDCGVGYMVTSNPCDAMIVHMTEAAARKYSKKRIGPMIYASPEMNRMMGGNRHNDNVLSKFFNNGATLEIGWGTPSHLSAADYKYVWISDYDRLPDDNGEGDIFTQASKRTQTFGTAGMTIVESSPGRDFLDIEWKPKTVHEAPPVGGILGLYNQGDRRLIYYNCPHCKSDFPIVPGLDPFMLPSEESISEELNEHGAVIVAKKYSKHIFCSECGSEIESKAKRELNSKAIWVPESDEPNSRASFWLSGVTAQFQTWESILEKEFAARLHYERTRDEQKLKAARNVDQGIPYVPVSATKRFSASELERRSTDLPKRVIPEGVRFLICTIDVQAQSFVVQVHGHTAEKEVYIIDRFSITRSTVRKFESHHEDNEGNAFAMIEPAVYFEDWDAITDIIMQLKYPLDDESGRSMSIQAWGCDSGGNANTTENAYSFWDKLDKLRLSDNFFFLKGDRPSPNSSRAAVKKTVLSVQSSTAVKTKVAGRMPLYILNSTTLKDTVNSSLRRGERGPGYIHFPDWLPMSFYEELTAEVRSEKGWDNPLRRRNESFDLMYYDKAVYRILESMEWNGRIDFDSPPPWAQEWDRNSNVDNPIAEVPFDRIKPRTARMRMK